MCPFFEVGETVAFDVHVRSGTQLQDADTGKDRLMRRHAQAHLLDHQVVRSFIEGNMIGVHGDDVVP